MDICVLVVLSKGQSYGYKIVQDLNGILDLSDTALYPVLKRLESSSAITSFNQEYNGRMRKYFTITPVGWDQLKNHMQELKELQDVCDFVRGQFNPLVPI